MVSKFYFLTFVLIFTFATFGSCGNLKDPYVVWRLIFDDHCIFVNDTTTHRDPHDCIKNPCNLAAKKEFCSMDDTMETTDGVCRPFNQLCQRVIDKKMKKNGATTKKPPGQPRTGQGKPGNQNPPRSNSNTQTNSNNVRVGSNHNVVNSNNHQPQPHNDATTKAPNCQDKNSNCDFWAKSNECQTNSAFMNVNCPGACKVGPCKIRRLHR